jgi:tRNA (adenine22-N1)-methyltransferase
VPAAAKLRTRLRAVAAAVPQGASVADVGAGDGQLAAWLAAAGHRVIATESRPGPLLRLRERLSPLGIDCRAGDGLSAVRPGEVDVAVVAGMGGRRIASILAADPEVVDTLQLLVLQPMRHLQELRAWLASAGLHERSATEAVEAGRRYTVLVVEGDGGAR